MANDAAAYINSGNANAKSGNWEEAIADYSRAIKLSPNLAAAYRNRGLTHYKKGDLERALADWKEVLRIDPNNDKARAGIRQVRQMQETKTKEAIALDPSNQIYQNNLQTVQNAKAKGNGQSAETIQTTADFAVKNDNEDFFEAASAAKKTEMTNNELAALIRNGAAHYQAKEFDAAIADYTQAIWGNPQNAAVYYNRGLALLGKGERERGIADFEKADALAPNNFMYQDTLKKLRAAAADAAKKAKMANYERIKTWQDGDTGPAGGVLFSNDEGFFEIAPAEYEFKSKDKFEAEKLCGKLKINGITGWRLPVLSELWDMYSMRQQGLGHFKNEAYWSSTGTLKSDCPYDNNRQCFRCSLARTGGRYNPDDLCDISYRLVNVSNSDMLYQNPLNTKSKFWVLPVREVTESDQAIADSHKGENFNPYKSKKRTMIGVGIAAIVLGIPLTVAVVGFISIIVGIAVLVKGIKY